MKKIIILFFCLFTLAGAVETQFYTFKGMDGFGKPVKTDGIGIHSKGYLTLIPKVETVLSPPEEIVWSLVQSGNVIYAGVGETGNIMTITADGKSSVLSKLGKFCVKALAVDKGGAVYAGGPDGVIHKFTEIINQTQFYATGEKYIWSMTFDKDGTCYAGTGPEGKIFKITSDGTGELLYDGKEKHILSLVTADGKLYAGTGGEGVIYKIDIKSKKGEVLAELPGQEIIDICLKDKNLYAVSNPGASGSSRPKPKSAPPKPGTPRPASKAKAGSSIFKVSIDSGDAAMFFKPAAGKVTSAALLEDGRIAAGSDVQGTLYLIESKDEWIVFSIPNVGTVRTIYPIEKGFLAGTEKKGFITRFSLNGKMEGEYISNVCEVPEVDRWGILETEVEPKEASVRYFFRTGKVKKTDENWSEFKEVLKGDLSVLAAGKSFFQMKLEIRNQGGKEVLKINRIKLSYRPVNKKPEIKAFNVVKKGNAPRGRGPRGPRGGGNNPQAAGAPQKPLGIQLMWKCMDPNGDILLYTISRKHEGGKQWVIEQKDIIQPKTMLITSFIPDGKYRIKLTASDEKANMKGKGFKPEKELDDCIIVDRTPPAVSVVSTKLTDKAFTVLCRAQDILSPIRGCSYRINDKEWESVAAMDLLYDELAEESEFLIDRKDISDGDVIIVRFDDDAMNYQLVRIEVKP